VKTFFDADGTLEKTATPEQMADGFTWACGFGKTDVVEFLLQRGMNVAAKLKNHGQTGLHGAATGGYVDTVELLLRWRAPVDMRDDSFDATPLGWALYGWSEGEVHDPRADYHTVVERLIDAGVPVKPAWLTRDDAFSKKLRADARMYEAIQRGLGRTGKRDGIRRSASL
jgi:hypothetical protein